MVRELPRQGGDLRPPRVDLPLDPCPWSRGDGVLDAHALVDRGPAVPEMSSTLFHWDADALAQAELEGTCETVVLLPQ
eukprot:5131551-Pyramimonas_sp.AAC.1